MKNHRLACLFLVPLLLTATARAAAPPVADPLAKLPPVFSKRAPESLDDLKAIEQHVEKVLERVTPAIVCVRVGAGSGSGVIISHDGLVLTAGHVSGAPGRDCNLIFPDGKIVSGKTLGAAPGADTGMIRITTKAASWPCVEIGKSAGLKAGDWCIARGHPGGYKKGRAPVVRVGRILNNGQRMIGHDCALVGGDSGGPLFDMTGKVIGIESNIGFSIQQNNAVPIDVFRGQWDRLVKGELIGVQPPAGVYLGINGDPEAEECRITQVVPDSPASKAGLKAGDVILRCDGQKIDGLPALQKLIRSKKAGDKIVLELRREEENLKLEITLAKR